MKPPIAIEKPCPLIQELFVNVGGCRFCDQCGHQVHNLSEMSAAERKRLMKDYQAGKRVCVAYRITATGEMQTAPARTGFGMRIRRLIGATVPFGLAACAASPADNKAAGQETGMAGAHRSVDGASSGEEPILLGGVPPAPPHR